IRQLSLQAPHRPGRAAACIGIQEYSSGRIHAPPDSGGRRDRNIPEWHPLFTPCPLHGWKPRGTKQARADATIREDPRVERRVAASDGQRRQDTAESMRLAFSASSLAPVPSLTRPRVKTRLHLAPTTGVENSTACSKD